MIFSEPNKFMWGNAFNNHFPSIKSAKVNMLYEFLDICMTTVKTGEINADTSSVFFKILWVLCLFNSAYNSHVHLCYDNDYFCFV